MFKIVTKKFIELKIEEIPAIWREKIAKSTDWFWCPKEDKGG